jgi:GDPmannose 4,6-dehydratase
MSKKITDAVKRIGQGSDEKLEIGDLDAIKEYSFAGDIVNGIWILVNQEDHFEANISSGKGYSILQWLVVCFGLIGKDWKEYVIPKQGFISPYRQLVSDPSLIFSLGWKPRTSFEDLAKMMMKN